MKMLGGRSFSEAFKGDSSSYVVNETMLRLMGMNEKNAIGKTLSFGGRKGTIIGVVKDFNFKSLQYAIDPLVLRLNKWGGITMVRTKPGSTETTIKALEKINKELNPAYPFTYNFLDKDLDNLYKGEQQMGSIFNLFAILAIFISCLGLYGLSAFMAEQRTKEIGVRKVLGASVFNIVYLLSGNFTRLIIIAMIVSVPLSWFAISKWLAGFAYRIDIGWVIFFWASLVALLIAWLTVSYESIKAAIANPVKSLRTE
jgi:ABC-type antimicrobial peptide transport system permease subunit